MLENQVVLDSRLIEKFEAHREFSKVLLDAFVLINKYGTILKFNSMFSTILGMRAIDVRKIGFFDGLINTEIPGTNTTFLKQLLDSPAPTRIDEVTGKRVVAKDDIRLIMSSFPYHDSDGSLLGAFILLRDITAEFQLQDKYKNKALESVTDPLTGLYTRRYFEEQINNELRRCYEKKEKPRFGLILIDLDKFKTVNDTYGHQAGDFVLVETAKVLKATSRRHDILGRFGGEELLVVIFDSGIRGAVSAAEKFRKAIQNHVYYFEGKIIPVTASIGVAMLSEVSETKE
ncbi:MAG: sensor domain-containing diguanylate cyclase, partial [Silvanigrellaceae bacterium]|nr:sensor domain-containing diguanylate cyclase [Silvanigrellaceae bacterium]